MAEPLALSVEPVLGYPREVDPGQSYVFTVDLRSPSSGPSWPYPDAEELVVYCLLDGGAAFHVRPLGEPALAIHRFGGTYGPARFLLSAAPGGAETGTVRVTLVNGWGTPLTVLETDEIRVGREERPAARPVTPEAPARLGAVWDGEGVSFALYSPAASRVELCLFDPSTPSRETRRHELRRGAEGVWLTYAHGLRPGQLYGYRVHGPYAPEKGMRFNPNKLLVDPYARAVHGSVDWRAPVYGYPLGDPQLDLVMDEEDSAWGVPKSVVMDPGFDWQGDHPPRVPWNETVIYEVHVRGFTMLHPEVPKQLRGTYAGFGSPPVIEHLKRLGITAVELMPVHTFVDHEYLLEKGLRNYWGYNTLNYFSPDARYSSRHSPGDEVREFKEMVKALHRAGIEVILDVVYNHTAEGNHLGPTLSFRGIDNAHYYRLVEGDPRYYMDYTGTGNSFNASHPRTLRLIMDSLRYWVQEMHVDGFRFDLAATLARELHDVDRLGSFLTAIESDPVISRVKLIAEPWDVGEGGYQVGGFPPLWSEWNERYATTVRRYWRGDPAVMGELGYRLTGSSDLYGESGRHPYASINYVTAHDGFTLADLVSYSEKHNEANGEGNRDGRNENHSWNCGVEGPTDDPAVVALREKQKRNLLATLFLSQGVPMLLAGDEMSRTQGGNNNAYCQDNEISWVHWALDPGQQALLEFTRRLSALRRTYPVLRRRTFFRGRPIRGTEVRDIIWLRPDGGEMSEQDWTRSAQALGVRLAGELDEAGSELVDDTLLLLMNAHPEPVTFSFPAMDSHASWEVLIDTASEAPPASAPWLQSGTPFLLRERSLALLARVEPTSSEAPGPHVYEE